MTKVKVAHLTSHHHVQDNRIFLRECRTLAAAGYEVVLIAQHPRDETIEGVHVLGIPPYRNRLERVTLTALRTFRRALAARPALYHFHDPELIPWGLLLRLMGHRVVYDVHEDFAQAAGTRSWIPGPLRPLVASLNQLLADLARRSFRIVIAERYYARRFPGATPVLNYPYMASVEALRAIERPAEALPRIRLIYAGSVTESRGALLHADLVRELPGCEVVMIGNCAPELAAALHRRIGDADLVVLDGAEGGRDSPAALGHGTGRSRLVLEGVGRFVPHARIVERLTEPWTAALAVFPYSEHYYEKELTKFFEYMAAGLPLVASSFPAWKALVEHSGGAGLCIDPASLAEAAGAVRWLHAHPEDAARMGRNGRRAVEQAFTWPSQAESLLALYRDMLGAGAPA